LEDEETKPKMHRRHGELFDEAITFIDDLQPEKEDPTTRQKMYLEHLKPSLHKQRETGIGQIL
jgi:hypothetical protein